MSGKILRSMPVLDTQVEMLEARNTKRQLIRPGMMVRCPERWSESLQATVPSRLGKVRRLYTQSDGQGVVETTNGHTLRLAEVRVSRAQDGEAPTVRVKVERVTKAQIQKE